MKRIGRPSCKRQRHETRIKKAKDAHLKRTIIPDVEFLNKDQLKKVVKQPTNNIRASGKRKHKVLKRLRHSQKDKSQMEVEVAEASKSKPTGKTPTGKTTSKSTGKKKNDKLKTDAEMADAEEDDSEVEMS